MQPPQAQGEATDSEGGKASSEPGRVLRKSLSTMKVKYLNTIGSGEGSGPWMNRATFKVEDVTIKSYVLDSDASLVGGPCTMDVLVKA